MDNPDVLKGKRLLILSGPMGVGHVRAALALEDAARRNYPELEVIHRNVLEWMTPGLRFLFTGFYHWLLRRHPGIWRRMYRSSNVPPHRQPLFRHMLRFWRRRFDVKLLEEVRALEADFVLCAHFLPGEVLGEGKLDEVFSTPSGLVITDFALHWVYVQPAMELFFVPNFDVSLLLTARGVDESRTHITGIPIFPKFFQPPLSRCLQLHSELGLPLERKLLMVVMGGEGIGRLVKIARLILRSHPQVGLLVLTGKNRKSFAAATELQKKYPGQLFPVSYTERIQDYMAVSYLVITKPGGVSTSECLAMKKPMLLIDPIPGHEERNAEYLVQHGLALFCRSFADLKWADIKPDAKWLGTIAGHYEKFDSGNAARAIIDVTVQKGMLKR